MVGDFESDFQEKAMEAIHKNRHTEIDPSSEDEMKVDGSVSETCCKQNLCTTVHFLRARCVLYDANGYAEASRSHLKVYLTQAETEFMEATGKERLSKADKEEVRDLITKQLREASDSGIKGFDMVWDLEDESVRFWSQSKGPCDEFEHLFAETFGLRLIPEHLSQRLRRRLDCPRKWQTMH